MQNRKVKVLALPLLILGFLVGQTPASATPPETQPVSSTPMVTAPKALGTKKVATNKVANKKTQKVRFDPNSAPIAPELIQLAIAAALTKDESGRYRRGAAGPNAFDCSGLISWAYAQAGITLPRGTDNLLPVLKPISREELLPGDLIFSGRNSSGIQHVALYIGDGNVIHATNAGASRTNQVRIDDLDGSWVMDHKAYGRILQ